MSKIDYPPVNEVGFFANKDKKDQEEREAKRKKMPADKKIIANL